MTLLKVLNEENEKVTEPNETEFGTEFMVEPKKSALCFEPERKIHPTISGFETRTDYLPKCLKTCGNEESTVKAEENKFNRIINGITPDVNDWPFLVHLFFYNTPNINLTGPMSIEEIETLTIEGHICGGTGTVYCILYSTYSTVLREVGQRGPVNVRTLEKFSIIDGL